MTRQSLREQHKQDKFKRIKKAARQLFEQRGYEATTTREIAEQAQIGTGTLFLYVQDKGELLLLLYEDTLKEMTTAVFASLPADLPLQDALMHLFTPFFHFYLQHPENARAFLKELLFRADKGGSHFFKAGLNDFFIIQLAQVIQQRQARGELRQDMDPYLAAGGFFALYFASITSWLGSFLVLDATFFEHLHALFGLQVQGMLPNKSK